MTLYLKYRPNTLEQVYGNREVVKSLSGMLAKRENCPHVFLFQGSSGCGKTTFGRIIANSLNCHEKDFTEVNFADMRGIDTVRDLIRQSHYKPIAGDVRVFLIDECHKMTNDAQNAILKILEDTPKQVYFILCTTEPNKLLPTIIGRCSVFSVKPLNEGETSLLIRDICNSEGESIQKSVVTQIYETSQGHPRNALQILDQVLRVPEELRLETAKKYIEEQTQSIELCRALMKPGAGWKEVSGILAGLKDQEAEGVRRHVLGYAQAILLKSDNTRAASIIESFWEPFYNIGFPGLVYACYNVVKNS